MQKTEPCVVCGALEPFMFIQRAGGPRRYICNKCAWAAGSAHHEHQRQEAEKKAEEALARAEERRKELEDEARLLAEVRSREWPVSKAMIEAGNKAINEHVDGDDDGIEIESCAASEIYWAMMSARVVERRNAPRKSRKKRKGKK